MNGQKKYISFLAALLCSILVLSACGKNESSGADKKSKETTLTDAMGKVTIPAEPKRILAPYMEDSLAALGVKPAAQWSIGDTVLDYLQPQLKDVPKIGWDMPLEQAIEADPDLIVFSSKGAIQNGQYEEYKKIAPVYVYKDEDSADWKKQLKIMGKITGKEKDAEKKIGDYEKNAEKASKDIKSSIGDETAAIIWSAGGKYYLFENNRFAGNVLYGDLGVSQPAMVKKLPKAEAAWQPVSLESLSSLDADHLFLVSLPNEAGTAKLKESSVFKSMPAAKTGSVYELDDPSYWNINGLIAYEKAMEAIKKSLVK
ncbi:ABC transporter substrate-binding protein [Peribacillus sp. SCS-37]|uniref:ABC transporter substrate-binding protein n=1 Tax=Paraperibacillus esterisolvens TaxID=3115296 RepID=UPI0039064EEF